jgi:hypothetical protein
MGEGLMAVIIVSATRQKNVRQKNTGQNGVLYFSVSHFSVCSDSVAETMIEAILIAVDLSRSIPYFQLPMRMNGAQ